MSLFSARQGRSRHRHAQSPQVTILDDPDGVSRAVFLLASGVFSVGLIFGGGDGSLGDVATQLLALPLLVLAAMQWCVARPRGSDRLALALVAGIAVLACVQLMPLPMSTWLSLPGRADLFAQMHRIGVQPAWTSLSLDPLATERALEWTLPAIAMFLAVRWMSARQQRAMVLLLFIGAVLMTIMDVTFRSADANTDVTAASLLAKAYQNEAGIVVPRAAPVDSAMTGLFSNHNHFGTFMAMTLPLMIAVALRLWAEGKRWKAKGVAAAMTLLGLAATALLAAAFETHSRAALLLGGLALMASVGLLRDLRLGRRILWVISGAALLVIVVIAFTAGTTALDRWGNGVDNDLRWQIHATTLDAARHFGPLGSGLGTFVQAYQAVPPREGMLPAYVNRAHGDYHELWLETGVPGALLIAGFILWWAWSSRAVWARPDEAAVEAGILAPAPTCLLARAASLSIALLLLHSYVEYPSRKTAILVVLGLCCGLLAPPSPPRQERSRRRSVSAEAATPAPGSASVPAEVGDPAVPAMRGGADSPAAISS